jgi:ABC-2 type transport system permease protein
MRLLGRSLNLQTHDSGLDEWLSHHGLEMAETLVLDPQNAAFPLPVTRDIGGFQVQEIAMLDYPYFIDIRRDGMSSDNAITADLPQVSMAWASPILVDRDRQREREVTELLRSSESAWLSASTDVLPQVDARGVREFRPEGETGRHLVGVISQGRFESFFADRESPLLEKKEEQEADGETETQSPDEPEQDTLVGVIRHSPESARIILYSSSDFLQDMVVSMAGAASGSDYLNGLQLMANSVDWALEDRDLLSIRARGQFNRTLPPMEQGTQVFWEYLNYALAILAIGLIGLLHLYRQRRRQARFAQYTRLQEA